MNEGGPRYVNKVLHLHQKYNKFLGRFDATFLFILPSILVEKLYIECLEILGLESPNIDPTL